MSLLLTFELCIVNCSQSVNSIIVKIYEEQLARNGRSEKDVCISKSASIIKSDVLQIPSNKETYPCSETLSDVAAQNAVLPDSLRSFLAEIFTEAKCEVKVASIGQAIIQAIRPRSIIAPLQLGLGVQLHHTFKSKFLVETLNKMGFSSSYSEIQKYRYCAASTIEDVVPSPTQVTMLRKMTTICEITFGFQ